MRPLIFTNDGDAEILRVIAHAKANPVSLAALRSMKGRALPPIRDTSEHVVTIPIGLRCVYSHEHQGARGLCRHLSVSVDGKGPGVEAVNEIAKKFGFKEGVNSAAHIWTEDIGDDRIAVNLIQPVLKGDET